MGLLDLIPLDVFSLQIHFMRLHWVNLKNRCQTSQSVVDLLPRCNISWILRLAYLSFLPFGLRTVSACLLNAFKICSKFLLLPHHKCSAFHQRHNFSKSWDHLISIILSKYFKKGCTSPRFIYHLTIFKFNSIQFSFGILLSRGLEP